MVSVAGAQIHFGWLAAMAAPARASESPRALARRSVVMAETLSVKMCRVPGIIRPDQMFFRPALVYQQMLDEHVADAGLEFSLDVSTGRNFARFISDIKIEVGSERYHEILRNQLHLVPDFQGRGDAAAVKKQLLAAGAWGDCAKLELLIRTCWVTPTIANSVLVETSQAGSADAVRVLLDAGASPDFASAELDGKTALHVACEAGHEEVAALLIPRMTKAGIDCKTRSSGCTAFDLLRRAELAGMARRLEALVPPQAAQG